MNKSVLISGIFIGACVVASPFIFDAVKKEQYKDKKMNMDIQLEIADVIALNKAAIVYKDKKGECPKEVKDMIGFSISREGKDRNGISYKTEGNCLFSSASGISREDDIGYQITKDRLEKTK